MLRQTRILLALGLAIVLGLGGIAWLAWPRLPGSVAAIKESGRLVVLTLEAPTIYQDSDDGPNGYEVDLVTAFAESLDAEVEFRVVADLDTLLKRLDAGHAHLAAGSLTATEARSEAHALGPAYKNVTEQLVCHRDQRMPSSESALPGADISVVAGSSYEETLLALQKQYEGLNWDSVPAGSAMPLLEEIAESGKGCTLADSHLVAYARRHHPTLDVSMDLTEEQALSWAVNDRIADLPEALETWFAEAHNSGALRQLDEHWFGHLIGFDYVDVASFRRRVRSRLPDYQPLFEQSAENQGFDWRLLAAQAYQESQWDPNARSRTGVRGLMMLTLPTANEVGVDNRLDPAQSIEGGALYLRRLYDRLPDGIGEPDRLWFALAAYNVGFGHLEDARVLADREGLDPNIWANVSDMLPRLSRSQYYRTVRFGYARGYEPVHYVRKVREYEAILRNALAEQATLTAEAVSAPPPQAQTDDLDAPG